MSSELLALSRVFTCVARCYVWVGDSAKLCVIRRGWRWRVGHSAVVLRDLLVSNADEAAKGRGVWPRGERRGATVRSVVVLERSEAKQDRKERGHPHPDAGRWCVHDGPCCEEYDVSVRQIEGNVWAQSSDAAPRGFGRGEADKEEVGPVVREDLRHLASALHEHVRCVGPPDRVSSTVCRVVAAPVRDGGRINVNVLEFQGTAAWEHNIGVRVRQCKGMPAVSLQVTNQD